MLVNSLSEINDVEVTVVAPAENQSGTSDKTTAGGAPYAEGATASGIKGTAVDGFPADTIGVALDELGLEPDLVVSGVNTGQNVGPLAYVSGTVGAGREAVRRGIPAIAGSAGLTEDTLDDYQLAADLIVRYIEEHRAEYEDGTATTDAVVNINVPDCTAGSAKAFVEVAPGHRDPGRRGPVRDRLRGGQRRGADRRRRSPWPPASPRSASCPRRRRAVEAFPARGGHRLPSTPVLRLVLPKGSLEKPTLELFEAADLRVVRSSTVEYKASIDDPRIDEVRILRPQEIPTYVAEGLFDLGIAGRDWVEETASDVTILGELQYSKASSQPFRIVLAVPNDSPYADVTDLPQGVRVSSEYPELTRQFFEKHGIQADIRLSYGATEAKVPDIVDCIVDGTETGRALRAAGLKIIGDVLTSYTALIANPAAVADPGQAARHGADQDAARRRDGGARQGAREAERRPRRPRRRDRAAAVDEVADRVGAVRRRAATRWRRSWPRTRSTR